MAITDTSRASNPLTGLHDVGQSVWLDFIDRNLLASGELRRLVEQDGVCGVTSNPAIFEKAIGGNPEYRDALAALESEQDRDAQALYETLAIRDIQDAADALRPVYEATDRGDGYVSLEVSPYLARDTESTIVEARRLWRAVGRENLMIKVPGTAEGVPAIQQLIGEGINVNVTLLFAQDAYERVADAYMAGLEQLVARGGDPHTVTSVASFFISRIDTAVDALLTARLETASGDEAARLRSLLGKVAIANGKLTYRRYQELYASPRWQALAARGAWPQRLLWASTGTKNPSYRDVMYVEELIAGDTVDTMPPQTLDAFRDHGRVRASLEEDVEGAQATLDTLAQVGISLAAVTNTVLDQGVDLFADAFDKLLSTVARQREAVLGLADRQTYHLPEELAADVQATLDDWRAGGKVRRLWAGDASLWSGADEADWLGWLGIVGEQLADRAHLTAIAAEVRDAGFTHVALLGMGGSSLCPEVMEATFGRVDGYPRLHVLDSTDPAQIRAFESRLDLRRTLFIVSSKSGTTLEPNVYKQYFFERVKAVVGAERAGERFISITDPGSQMQQVAERDGFRHVFFGRPNIGGRYSALSDFGMVPAAAMGVDVVDFLNRAQQMVHSCHPGVPAADNPGVVLGTIMGVLARAGRDKVTLVASPGIWDLGAWLEQLLAESTGKQGKGLIPVDREPLGPPAVYGADRLFVYLRLATEPDAAQDTAVDALEQADQPVVRITVADRLDVGQEFFRWEIATAVAGAILGINAFNQPDVEASKLATRKLTTAYEQTGALPAETPVLEDGPIALYTDARNAQALAQAAGGERSLVGYLRAHLARLQPGDYFALLAYVEMNAEHEATLQAARQAVRDTKRVATCLGFGPRFLHSTGQAYKGGPNSGVVLQLTCNDAADLPVPGQTYTFGIVKAAQARGDFEVLAERERRALRVHLGADVAAGLATLRTAIDAALR
jgi:transaldolase / glucose-6-phosphate isomerase